MALREELKTALCQYVNRTLFILVILKWILFSLKFSKTIWSLKALAKKENELNLCYSKWILHIKLSVWMLFILWKYISLLASLMLGIQLPITGCIGQCVPGRRCLYLRGSISPIRCGVAMVTALFFLIEEHSK